MECLNMTILLKIELYKENQLFSIVDKEGVSECILMSTILSSKFSSLTPSIIQPIFISI